MTFKKETFYFYFLQQKGGTKMLNSDIFGRHWETVGKVLMLPQKPGQMTTRLRVQWNSKTGKIRGSVHMFVTDRRIYKINFSTRTKQGNMVMDIVIRELHEQSIRTMPDVIDERNIGPTPDSRFMMSI